MWGFFPLYFKTLQSVPPLEIMFNRVVWSFLFLALVLLVLKSGQPGVQAIRQPRAGDLRPSGSPLSGELADHIYGGQFRQVVETSLGYFINPLFSVALGVIF
jgi:chloramphenicol-sensitive protein RarD